MSFIFALKHFNYELYQLRNIGNVLVLEKFWTLIFFLSELELGKQIQKGMIRYQCKHTPLGGKMEIWTWKYLWLIEFAVRKQAESIE